MKEDDWCVFVDFADASAADGPFIEGRHQISASDCLPAKKFQQAPRAIFFIGISCFCPPAPFEGRAANPAGADTDCEVCRVCGGDVVCVTNTTATSTAQTSWLTERERSPLKVTSGRTAALLQQTQRLHNRYTIAFTCLPRLHLATQFLTLFAETQTGQDEGSRLAISEGEGQGLTYNSVKKKNSTKNTDTHTHNLMW